MTMYLNKGKEVVVALKYFPYEGADLYFVADSDEAARARMDEDEDFYLASSNRYVSKTGDYWISFVYSNLVTLSDWNEQL